MTRKKIENLIFNILKLLPLILFLGWYLMAIIRNQHNTFDITALSTYQTLLSYINLGSLNSLIVEPIVYFMSVFGLSNDIVYVVSNYIQYIVVIELVHLLYDVIIFIPRSCRSIVERGM